MNVEPDSKRPGDGDASVPSEEQTANPDSSFELSFPLPGKSKRSDSKREEKNDQTLGKNEAAKSSKSLSSEKAGDDFEPSMSILDIEKSIKENPDAALQARGSEEGAESKPETADDTVGGKPSPIGRYQVRRLLGQGAFGRVYEAHDPQLDRRVAVKVSKDVKGKSAIDRFLREARAAAHLRHPAIIPVFEYGQADDLSMIVYELVDGETLRSYINRNAPLKLSDSVSIIRKIAEGLDYAHNEGIIHRDMKPDNVLMDKKGEPHIADFGCARRFDDQDTSQTIEGSVLGTPMYMSPEQASGQAHQADGRSDVWSLGIMMYEMVSGKKPFEGTLTDLMHLIRHHDAKPLRKVHPSTPLDIETICSKCLRRELDYRFATAGELADELERFQRGEPILSRRISVLTRTWLWAKRNRAVASLLTTVAVTLMVGIGVSLYFGITASNALNAKTKAENQRAATSLESIAGVESSSLTNILKDLKLSSNTMLEPVRQRLAELGQNDTHAQRRLNIALLHITEPKDRVAWFDDSANLDLFLSADGGELSSFCNACLDDEKSILIPGIKKNLVPALQEIATATDKTSEQRFRAAGALALLDSESHVWMGETIANAVVGHLTAMNLVEVKQWLPVLKPVRSQIRSELKRIFMENRTIDNPDPETAAAALSNLCEPDYIIESLVPISDARQLSHLMSTLKKNPQNSIDLLNERMKSNDLKYSEKSNLILALIQLGCPDVWPLLELSNDNSSSSEVIESLGPAATSVDLLLLKINDLKDTTKNDDSHKRDALAVALLALRQYSNGQIPVSNRREVFLPNLMYIFENHRDARVHSSVRCLMTEWGFHGEVRQLEEKLRQPKPDPDKNWHVDESGNTFVLFEPENSSRRFGICIHEVTIGQFSPFAEYMLGQKELKLDGATKGGYETFLDQELDKNLPMFGSEALNFFKTLEFCRWLSEKQELDLSLPPISQIEKEQDGMPYKRFDLEKYGYRLPTAREWQFACGVNTITKRSFGKNKELLERYAWYESNSNSQQHPVCQKQPNEAGLFDMLGNVSEWCLDYYPQGVRKLPEWKPGDKISWENDFTDVSEYGGSSRLREHRGGSFEDKLENLTTARRLSATAANGTKRLGFRLARTYPPSNKSDQPVEQHAN